MVYLVLLVEHTIQKKLVWRFDANKYLVNQASQRFHLLLYLIAGRTVFCLLGILVQIGLQLLLKRRIKSVNPAFSPLLKGCEYDAITRVFGDVASDEFAVHSDGIAFDVELHSLSSGDILEAVFYQVYACLIFVFRYATAQKIIGIKTWSLVGYIDKTESPAHKKIKVHGREHLLVAPAIPFLHNHDSYKLTDRCVAPPHVSFFEQGLECVFINVAGNQLIELIMPCLRVVVFLQSATTHQI